MQDRETGGDRDPTPRPPGPARWKAPAGRRVRGSAISSRSAPGAPGFPGKTWRHTAGAPCVRLGTPGTRGPGEGWPPLWGRILLGSGPPPVSPTPTPPCSFLGLGGGKEAGRFFLMKKKIWAVAPGLSLPPRPPHPSQQILSEESAPPPGISAARTLPGRGRAGGEAEESSTCHFQRL